MAHTVVTGVCKLCHREGLLCKSHYLGRALHRLSIERDGKQFVMTPKEVRPSNHQLWQHLLCFSCEQRFNKGGERYALSLLNRTGDFRLLERMTLSLDRGRDGPATKFSGSDMGVDTAQLGYFVLSLLWRGSVTKWSTVRGQTTSIRLGDFEEPIRAYLLGETDFPDHVHIILTVCTDALSQGMIYAPWEVDVDNAQFMKFEVLTRGLWFHVALGEGLPFGTHLLCCVKSPIKVLFMKDCKRDTLDAARSIAGTAKDLAESLARVLAPATTGN